MQLSAAPRGEETQAVEPRPSVAPAFSIDTSRQFAGWLAEQHISLAFTTYQSGKLFLLGLRPDGRLSVHERTFNRCMGLWSDGQTLLMSSLYQLWRFENALERGAVHQEYDRLYVPIVGYTTGDIDIHDIAATSEKSPIFVATLASCLGTTSEVASFRAIWKPPFISRIALEDRCHLNGLALKDGRPAYVTAVAASDTADGWREHRRDGGIVLEVETGEVVAAGLSMPHSPRLHEGELYVLNSGTGEFGRIDRSSGTFETIAFCPGYLRGLAFAGRFAIVGLSRPRADNKTFAGLMLGEELQRRKVSARCGLMVIDLKSGDCVHHATVGGVVEELYDVVTLPRVRRPMALGFKSDEIRRTIKIG
jgi:uncharacterized protein (TIGR03032 family)